MDQLHLITTERSNFIIYWLGIQDDGTNAEDIPPNVFHNSWRGHGILTLLILAAIKYGMSNDKNGSNIYLQTPLNKSGVVSFYTERIFGIIENDKMQIPENLQQSIESLNWVGNSNIGLLKCKNKEFYSILSEPSKIESGILLENKRKTQEYLQHQGSREEMQLVSKIVLKKKRETLFPVNNLKSHLKLI